MPCNSARLRPSDSSFAYIQVCVCVQTGIIIYYGHMVIISRVPTALLRDICYSGSRYCLGQVSCSQGRNMGIPSWARFLKRKQG
jgi:hypothetical protein